METIAISIRADTREAVEEYADERHDGNRSAAIRDLLDRGLAYDDLKRERDRFERKLSATNARNDDVDELVEYVEEERERRRQERRTPPVWTRARRFVFGYDPDGSEA